ncbi:MULTISPECIES: PAP2 family lipid A phosphatase [unclassified Moraxella]|uniref:PAP2 family lipid A phosphatase n=1 Tax=unclassified Moraxella TaxID=2685852 RepID=UPI003AF56926
MANYLKDISVTPSPFVKQWRFETLLASGGAILATLFIEHSSLDVAVSQWFYQGNRQWLIDKSAHLPDWIFYTGIKRLLIVFEVYIILAWLQRVLLAKKPQHRLAQPFTQPLKLFRPLQNFSQQELCYLAVTMIVVPSVVATLKAVTNVPCPSHLQIFGGEFAYLSLWQDIVSGSGQKCFPAAHASSGFALYAWAFLPSLAKKRWQIAIAVTVLAWLMGGYKMAIGDHFLSHTLVSMCLGWAIGGGCAWLMFKK